MQMVLSVTKILKRGLGENVNFYHTFISSKIVSFVVLERIKGYSEHWNSRVERLVDMRIPKQAFEYIGHWRELEDPGKNCLRLCEVGTGHSPSHAVKKKRCV